ncbi:MULTISPECIES: hypothetical protein [Sorangium]|uniref:Cytochrome c domain-containing protein n=1 Tax=Sorangium cellulosum TaxID=56 RepID=A0A4P2QN82_SORCE|nr:MULTISPECIES: hypothetical protein [Sorangium]AUX30983.1 uncharacterized protein SOCE836_031000 [Sorangium cellulosum]WCQ90365.1 hypothetical protein NQZ70_03069 [Sorangium sp. Soce836]
MRRTITPLALLLASLSFATLGCDSKGNDATTPGAVAEGKPTESAAAAATTAAPATTPAAATAEPSAAAAAAPAETAAADAKAEAAAADAKAEAAPKATAAASAAAPAATGAAQAGEKKFECGAKGQKLCPMQAWMKSTMASATSSGDGEKIAAALQYVAGKPPPGMGSWATISKAGASKAKAGDIDGAKASCKQCHDLYKEQYKKTMRDRPW